MKCTNCAKEFQTGKFCPNCGTPAPNDEFFQSSLASAPGAAPAEPIQPVLPRPSAPVGTYAPTARPAAPVSHAPIAPMMPKKRRAWPIAVIALVLIVALVVGALTIIKTGPLNTIVSAAKKNLDSGSFTMEFSIKSGSTRLTYFFQVQFDPEEEILNFYGEMSYPGGERMTVVIYDGYGCTKQERGDEVYYSYGEIELDELFEAYQEYSDEVDGIFDAYSMSSDAKDILFLLEEFDDATDGWLGDQMDLEVLTECLQAYQRSMNDKSWLKKNAGFTQTKEDGATIYTYEPELRDFMEESLIFFEDSFEHSRDYDTCMDWLDEEDDFLNDLDPMVRIGVKGGYLTFVELTFAIETITGYDEDGEYEWGWTDMSLEVAFTDIGKTELDLEELEDMAAECEKGSEDRYYD